MRHISRSTWYNGRINQFLDSKDPELYLELYPSEVDRVNKLFPQLSVSMLDKVNAHKNDERYHVLIEK